MNRLKHKVDYTTYFSWEIPNASEKFKCRVPQSSLKSDEFFLDTSNINCHLEFKPVALTTNGPLNYSSLYFKVSSFGQNREVRLRFQIWLENKNGIKKREVIEECTFQDNRGKVDRFGFPTFVCHDFFYGPNSANFLIDDTLFICCKVTRGDLMEMDEVPANKRLRLGLANLRDDAVFSDFTIKAGGKEFKVIKALLAAQSDIFRSMFSLDTIEAKESRVEIKDASAEAMQAFIDFLYTGSIENINAECDDLFILADKYQVNTLKSECSKRLCQTVSDNNVIRLLNLSFMHNDVNLKRVLLEHVTHKDNKMYFNKLLLTNEFDQLCDTNPIIAKEIKKAILDKVASALS